MSLVALVSPESEGQPICLKSVRGGWKGSCWEWSGFRDLQDEVISNGKEWIKAGGGQALDAGVQLRDPLTASLCKWANLLAKNHHSLTHAGEATLAEIKGTSLSRGPKPHVKTNALCRYVFVTAATKAYLWLTFRDRCPLCLWLQKYFQSRCQQCVSANTWCLQSCKREENISLTGSHRRKGDMGSLCLLRREDEFQGGRGLSVCHPPPLTPRSNYWKGWGQITAISISAPVDLLTIVERLHKWLRGSGSIQGFFALWEDSATFSCTQGAWEAFSMRLGVAQ